jgi:peptidoglycan/xylan/chitin deacetylase (PgdA/CDA1 family)
MVGLNNVSIARFKNHLDSFLKHSFSERIFITFDDGYEDIYLNAFPILQNYKIQVIVFPITNYLAKCSSWDVNFKQNKTLHLNPDQITKLANSGWEIGSHGHFHISNSKYSIKELEYDIQCSMEILENISNKKVKSYTPPFGILHPNLIQVLEKLGFENLFLHQNSKKSIKNFNSNINIYLRSSMYSIDNNRSIIRKLHNSKYETIKENIIHFCSKATIGAKEFL